MIDHKFIKGPKLKSLIKFKLHRQPRGVIISATISRHSSRKHYISLLCKEEMIQLPETNLAIGIDLGITDFAILYKLMLYNYSATHLFLQELTPIISHYKTNI